VEQGAVTLARPSIAELREAFSGRRVLVTGHTGFKGGWLTLWLHALGAHVTGLALAPADRGVFRALALEEICESILQDVRDAGGVARLVERARPEAVFHLAAQPLVRASYTAPLETLEVNTLGTANVLEAIRLADRPCAVVIVTSDKCYQQSRTTTPLSELDRLGGDDPYSCSKAAAELVVESWRRSYFPAERVGTHGVGIATARAGNVVGGGDYAADRLVPDAVRAWEAGAALELRNPDHVRPWQHVLEPLAGYLLLAAELLDAPRPDVCGPWNFGPPGHSTATVAQVAEAFARAWNPRAPPPVRASRRPGNPEATVLRLSTSKAESLLSWRARWPLPEALARTATWYAADQRRVSPQALRDLTLTQIADWLAAPGIAAQESQR
jgi:CDP-glucose 4,6-dehydratase